MGKLKFIVSRLLARWKQIWPLALNDFKSKYASSQLGLFWAFFKPVVMAGVYMFVFSVIGRAAPVGDIYPYALWMLPGLIVWFVFSDSVSSGVNTLTEYSFLVKNIRFTISILPSVKVVSAFIIHTFFVGVVFVLYLVFGLPVKIYLLQLPYYYFATFMFTLSLTRIVATLQPFFKDLTVADLSPGDRLQGMLHGRPLVLEPSGAVRHILGNYDRAQRVELEAVQEAGRPVRGRDLMFEV